MSIQRFLIYQIECDAPGCDVSHEFHPGVYANEVVRHTRSIGWLIGPGRKSEATTICPRHTQEGDA